MKTLFFAAQLLASSTAAHADALAFPDRNRAAVVDAAHVLPANVAASLNQRIVAWDKATGHQFVVATVPSLQGRDIATYGYQMGRAWGLGRKGINDGAILILAPTERKVRIEVGRGLEGDLTDAETSVIIHGTIVPKLKAGDVPGALCGGADAVMAAVPAGAGDMTNAPHPKSNGWAWAIGLALLAIWLGAMAWLLIRFRRRMRETDDRIAAIPTSSDDSVRTASRFSGGYQPRYGGGAGIPPTGGSGASYEPRRSTTVIAPVIINNSPSYDTSPSWGSSSSDSGSSSSSDSGSSSSGFDSGGGDFGGGGSDSSY